MRISTRGRYGLRIMLELAASYKSGPVSRLFIAKNQSLSAKYAHSLITTLVTASLVRSIRGNQGGYILSFPPEKITILEIVEAMEGPLSLVDCVVHEENCPKVKACVAHDLWFDLTNMLKDKLASITLAQLLAYINR